MASSRSTSRAATAGAGCWRWACALHQLAKPHQFREAKAFLDGLPQPQLVVPGNHDVPLYNVFQRVLSPLGKYKRIVTRDLAPEFIDDEIAVVGVNTSRSLVWK